MVDRRQTHRQQQCVDIVQTLLPRSGIGVRRLFGKLGIRKQRARLFFKIFAEQRVFLMFFCHYTFPFPVCCVR